MRVQFDHERQLGATGPLTLRESHTLPEHQRLAPEGSGLARAGDADFSKDPAEGVLARPYLTKITFRSGRSYKVRIDPTQRRGRLRRLVFRACAAML